MKKILFVTSKHPLPSDSRDGGDSTVSEMVRAFGACCQLDILFFRESDGDVKIPFVNKVFFQNTDFANYNCYSCQKGEKFLVRLQQAEISAKKIVCFASDYDVIIVQHAMFILKLAEYDVHVFKKIILLPMFTGTEYIKAQDYVPPIYIETEKIALRHTPKFITPGNVEREILMHDYGIPTEKIFVIPRSISGIEFIKREHCKKGLQLVYIASIRHQKAHKEAIELFKHIKKSVPLAQLHCVGTVQDKNLFRECMMLLQENSLDKDVIFHGTLNRTELNDLLRTCDINISVSLWETFGRGIFEGMSAGLPTVVLQRILSVNDFPKNIRPVIVPCIKKMVDEILLLYEDENFFKAESHKGKLIQEYLSFERIQKVLQNVVLSA